MKTTYASVETKAAEIASDFGRDLATRWFGAEIVASLPTYVRGPKAGLPKGWLVWDKAVTGGWDKGAVVRPNEIVRIRIGSNRYASPNDESTVWYKLRREDEPSALNAARGGDLWKRLSAERRAAEFERSVAELVAEWAACEDAIREDARFDAASREAVRRMEAGA